MREVIENIIGKDLTLSLVNVIKELDRIEADEKEVYRNIKGFNDISLLCMYLLSLDYKNNLPYYIKKSYQKKMDDRIKDFKDSENPYKYLKKLEKIDVINLAYSLGLYDLSDSEIKKLSEEDNTYYKIFTYYFDNMV